MKAIGPCMAALLAATLGAAPMAQATPEADEPGVARDADPLETMNRGIFWFNERVDRWALEPVATAWDFVLPDRVQTSIQNVFENAALPINLTTNLLQGKPTAAGIVVARFAVNTTVGVAGLFDPAAHWGLEPRVEDFGQTLGVWGVPPGPYLVLPLLGPSTVRDGGGLAVDSLSRVWPWFAPFYVSMSVAVGDAVNERSLVLEEVEQARAASLDFYAAVRQAYLERRRRLIADAQAPVEDENDLYFYEEPAVR
jgi:phospholipid-binding lipoprotein MlaA